MVKLKRMRWVGHVAQLGGEMLSKFCVEHMNRRDHLEGVGIDGRVILIWIIGK
jgi:hypothetical protein